MVGWGFWAVCGFVVGNLGGDALQVFYYLLGQIDGLLAAGILFFVVSAAELQVADCLGDAVLSLVIASD